MATIISSLSAPGIGTPFAPATGRFSVAVSGPFQGAAVLIRSLDGGNTWVPSATQGPAPNGPLFAGGPGTVTVELIDATAGVEYAVQASAPPGGIWVGTANYALTDVPQATVIVAPGRTLQAGNVNCSTGQTVTIDRTAADAAFARGFILPNY